MTASAAGVLPGTSAARPDVIVIGAGIVGLTAALHLARADRRVLVLDRGMPWREASGVNAGTIALQNKPTSLLTFYSDALDEWERLAAMLEREPDYVRAGGLRVAGEAEADALHADLVAQRSLGVTVEWLAGQELRRFAPWLGASIVAATHCARDGFFSPLLAGEALIKAVAAAGGRCEWHVSLDVADCRNGVHRLRTSLGEIEAPTVVIAAGAWTGEVARLFGVDVPLQHRTIILHVTERVAQFMQNRVVTHADGHLTLKQYPNGSCILGGGFPGVGNPQTGQKDVPLGPACANVEKHCSVVPALRCLNLIRSWAGYVANARDGMPVIGPVQAVPGLFLAVPTEAGFTAGPLVGKLAAEAVLAQAAAPAHAGMAAARLLQ